MRNNGSRTFYFFDFDDNTMFLQTKVGLLNAKTGKEKLVGTEEFAAIRGFLGAPGPWRNYEIWDGTYRFFRDLTPEEEAQGLEQHFVRDVREAIADKDEMLWKAPSWRMFVHACKEQRPLSIITARGHSEKTIRAGVSELVKEGLLPAEPNYLSIHAVSNKLSKQSILDGIDDPVERDAVLASKDPTSALKHHAIRQTVAAGVEKYGKDKKHRFGMSDDDPGNIDLIVHAMAECKELYPDKRFFVIDTNHSKHVKLEVFPIDFPVTKDKMESNEFIG